MTQVLQQLALQLALAWCLRSSLLPFQSLHVQRSLTQYAEAVELLTHNLYTVVAGWKGLVLVQVWLQEFAWTEADKPIKLAARNAMVPNNDKLARQPMFCFETMLNLLYWSCFVYDHKKVHYCISCASRAYGAQIGIVQLCSLYITQGSEAKIDSVLTSKLSNIVLSVSSKETV